MEPVDINLMARVLVAVMAILLIVGSAILLIYGLQQMRRPKVRASQTGAPPAVPKPEPPPAKPMFELKPIPGVPDAEGLIGAAAKSLERQPDLIEIAWVAAVPHAFDVDILKELHPSTAKNADALYGRLRHMTFAEATPEGRSRIQPAVRRAILYWSWSTPEQRENLCRRSARAAKYYYRLQFSTTRSRPNRLTRFMANSFFRFFNADAVRPQAQIEWLYHLALAYPDDAARALWNVGSAWLARGDYAHLQGVIDALEEHAQDGRLFEAQPRPAIAQGPMPAQRLFATWSYFKGCLALNAHQPRAALRALNIARQAVGDDWVLRDHVMSAIGQAHQSLSAPERIGLPSRPNQRQWEFSADMLPANAQVDQLRRFEEMLNLYRWRKDLQGVGTTLRLMGELQGRRDDHASALQWYQKALEVYGQSETFRPDEALIQKLIGDELYALQRDQEAQSHYTDALAIYDGLGAQARLGKADALKARGDALFRLDRYEEAQPDYDAAVLLYHDAGAQPGEAEVLLAQGRLLEALGQSAAAQQRFDSALDLYQQSGSEPGKAFTWLIIGDNLEQQGNLDDALNRYEEALRAQRAQKNLAREADTLKKMGDVLMKLNRSAEAKERYQQAVAAYRAARLLWGEADAHLALSRVNFQSQEFKSAREHAETALDLYRKVGYRRGQADAHLALGDVQFMERRSDDAEESFHTAWTMYAEIDDAVGKALATFRWADEQTARGSEEAQKAALIDYQDALRQFMDLGDDMHVEETWGRIGHVQALLGQPDEAALAYTRAMAYHSPSEPGWRGYQALVGDRLDTAMSSFNEAQQSDRRVSWQVGLALAYFARSEFTDAENNMDEALSKATPADRAAACRWLAYMLRQNPGLKGQADQLKLQC